MPATVVCECGGHPICEDGSKTDGVVRETHRCDECGRRRTLLEDMRTRSGARLSGCLTTTGGEDTAPKL